MLFDQNYQTVQTRLRSHLQFIVQERNPYLATANHFFVREYIRDVLSQRGATETREFQWHNQFHQNLILKLPRTIAVSPKSPLKSVQSPLAPILIGAHYDSVAGIPGADDNGTGVTVLLELAQQFSQYPTTHSI